MSDMTLRERYLLGMLRRVRSDVYPSNTHLDLLEAALFPEELEPYLRVLIEKVEGDNYPSVDMLGRIQRVIARMPQPAG